VAAFIVGTITVRDEALWQRYLAGVAETLRMYGGEAVFRGSAPVALAGRAHGERVVVARFADMAALRRWHESAEYQALVPLRDRAAEVVLTAYQDSPLPPADRTVPG
jgi:uncharacterized protein (DUF1330 family)